MKTQKAKLGLSRLTLCQLTAPELSEARGGLPPAYPTAVFPSDACPIPTSR
jgi:hypothetical protein